MKSWQINHTFIPLFVIKILSDKLLKNSFPIEKQYILWILNSFPYRELIFHNLYVVFASVCLIALIAFGLQISNMKRNITKNFGNLRQSWIEQ